MCRSQSAYKLKPLKRRCTLRATRPNHNTSLVSFKSSQCTNLVAETNACNCALACKNYVRLFGWNGQGNTSTENDLF